MQAKRLLRTPAVCPCLSRFSLPAEKVISRLGGPRHASLTFLEIPSVRVMQQSFASLMLACSAREDDPAWLINLHVRARCVCVCIRACVFCLDLMMRSGVLCSASSHGGPGGSRVQSRSRIERCSGNCFRGLFLGVVACVPIDLRRD